MELMFKEVKVSKHYRDTFYQMVDDPRLIVVHPLWKMTDDTERKLKDLPVEMVILALIWTDRILMQLAEKYPQAEIITTDLW